MDALAECASRSRESRASSRETRDSRLWNLDSVDYSDLRLYDDEAVVLCSSRN